MPNPRLVDERLRSWLASDQAAQERMCRAILALDSRYSNVRPRRPRGGQDQGRDIDATFEDGRDVFGAVGFRNSANDSSADKRWVSTKFRKDIARALDEEPRLKVFAFFTNVDLTDPEQTRLKQSARNRGIEHCDVFARERMIAMLDSPAGYAIRFNYLEIPLDTAEQQVFFARWGKDIERVVTSGFSTIENRVDRLEFLQECGRPLQVFGFDLQLMEPTPFADLGHFRAAMFVEPPPLHGTYEQLGLWIRDDWRRPNSPALRGGFWTLPLGDGHGLESTAPAVARYVSMRGQFSEWDSERKVMKLGDLDRAWAVVFVTQPLFDRVASLRMTANGYVLLDAPREDLRPYEPNGPVSWPDELNETENEVPWIRIDWRGFTTRFDFSSETPPRAWRPRSGPIGSRRRELLSSAD
jgi:hypothetical protein